MQFDSCFHLNCESGGEIIIRKRKFLVNDLTLFIYIYIYGIYMVKFSAHVTLKAYILVTVNKLPWLTIFS